MSTITEIISRVDDTKPNAFSDSAKLAWINTVEGFIATQIHNIPFTPHGSPSDGETLLAATPYDIVYEYYIKAMIDNESKDLESYNNNIILYNGAFADYARYYIRSRTEAPETATVKNYW